MDSKKFANYLLEDNLYEAAKALKTFVDELEDIYLTSKTDKDETNAVKEYLSKNKKKILDEIKKDYNVIFDMRKERDVLSILKLAKDILKDKVTKTDVKDFLEMVSVYDRKSVAVMFPDLTGKILKDFPKDIYDMFPDDANAIKKLYPEIDFPDDNEYE